MKQNFSLRNYLFDFTNSRANLTKTNEQYTLEVDNISDQKVRLYNNNRPPTICNNQSLSKTLISGRYKSLWIITLIVQIISVNK